MKTESCHDANFVRVVMMLTLSSLMAPQVVIKTTCGDTSDDKVGIMTTLSFQCINPCPWCTWVLVIACTIWIVQEGIIFGWDYIVLVWCIVYFPRMIWDVDSDKIAPWWCNDLWVKRVNILCSWRHTAWPYQALTWANVNSTCWIVLRIIKDVFILCIIHWTLFNRWRPDSHWSNCTYCLSYTANGIPPDALVT